MTAADPGRRTWVEHVMGLPVSVTVRGPAARGTRANQLVQGLYAELRRVDRVFSTYRADSEVNLVRSGALARELASSEMREVLALCAQARALTGGCFDAELPRPDGRRLLDPSGLVKGWAVERAAGALTSLAGHDWLVNAGGDVLGHAEHGPAWRVAVEDPRRRDGIVAVLPLREGAVATSGAAARGQHLVDPRTGEAASGQVLSATVMGPSLTWADVLATAAYVEGAAALVRLDALPSYELLLVLPDGELQATARAAARLRSAFGPEPSPGTGHDVGPRPGRAPGAVPPRPLPVQMPVSS